MLEDDDDQYLDNQDDDEEAIDDPEAEQVEEPEEPRERRGDPSVALRQEREKNRALKEQVEQIKRDNERAWALMEAQGRPQTPQRDVQAERIRMAERLIDSPDEVFQERDNHLRRQITAEFAPMMAEGTKLSIRNNSEWDAAYQVPEVRELIDAAIENQIQTTGRVDKAVLQSLFDMPLIKRVARESKPAGNNAAKQKLASTVTGSRPAEKRGYEEVLGKAQRDFDASNKGREARQRYLASLNEAKKLQT